MIELQWTDKKKEHVIRLVEKYLLKHGCAEGISQSDDGQIDAIELACDLADAVDPQYVD